MSILWRLALALLGALPVIATPPDATIAALDHATDNDADSVDGEPPTGIARGPPNHLTAFPRPVPTSPPGQAPHQNR